MVPWWNLKMRNCKTMSSRIPQYSSRLVDLKRDNHHNHRIQIRVRLGFERPASDDHGCKPRIRCIWSSGRSPLSRDRFPITTWADLLVVSRSLPVASYCRFRPWRKYVYAQVEESPCMWANMPWENLYLHRSQVPRWLNRWLRREGGYRQRRCAPW